MPQNPPREIELYRQVPVDSTLELRVEPQGDGVTSHAVFQSAGSTEQWLQAEIQPGPKIRALNNSMSRFLTVQVGFLAAATVVVRVRILKNGTVHSQPINWEINGNADDTAVRGLLIQMA